MLCRYLMIECEDPEPNVKHDARVREMYLVVMKKFLQVRRHLSPLSPPLPLPPLTTMNCVSASFNR